MSTVAPRSPPRRGSRSRSTVRRPPPVSTTSRPAGPRPSRTATQARQRIAVAAHLGDAAVGVEEHHRRSRHRRRRAGATIRPSAPIPRWRSQSATAWPRRARGRRRRRRPSRLDTRKSLPVACSFAELDRHHRLQIARSAGSRPSGFAAAPNQVMRGSRRNHMRWRRAKARVRRTAVSKAASSGGLRAVEMGQELLVADRLAGGARQPGAAGRRQPADLVEQPRLAHRREAPRRSAGSSRPGAARPRRSRTGNTGVAEGGDAGSERRERPAGQADHLERPHDAADVVRIDPRRGDRVGVRRARRRPRRPRRARRSPPRARPAARDPRRGRSRSSTTACT